jgi:hypothetical protein
MNSIDSGIYEKQRTFDLELGGAQVPMASSATADEVASRNGRSLPLIAQRFRGGLKTPPGGDVADPRIARFAADDAFASNATRNKLLKPYRARIDQLTDQPSE